MTSRLFCCCLAALFAWAGGCDQADEPAVVVQRPPATTRSALPDPAGEPRRPLPLVAVPLIVDAPASWKVEADAGRFLLRGRSTHGDIEAMITFRRTLKPELVAKELEQIQRHAQGVPDQTLQIAGNDALRIVEQIERLPPVPTEVGTNETPITFYRWLNYYYVQPPTGLDFHLYEINLVLITEDQVKKDADLIRGVLNSARFDPTSEIALPAAPTSP